MVLSVDMLQHAALGALVSGGGIAAAQCLLARKLQQPSSFALAVGSFVGVFRFLESWGRDSNDKQQDEHDGANSSRAAAVAAIVALFLLEGDRKRIVLSYAAIEAMLALSREHTALADVKYIEVLLGIPVYTQIIHTWVCNSDLLTKAELGVFDGPCALRHSVLQRMRDEIPTGKLLSRCDVFHRGETCSQFHSGYFVKGMKRAARIHIPIYLFSAVLMKYKQWLWGPRPDIVKIAIQYLRTCASLTLVYQIPFFSSCYIPSNHHRAVVILAGMSGSLSMFVEHARRRGTVLKAVAIYSLCSAAVHAARLLKLTPAMTKSLQYALFSASIAVIFQQPEKQSKTIMNHLFGYDVSARTKRDRAPRRRSTVDHAPTSDEEDA
uniref:Transmembrane protein 135 N-terminal domain-containing protein n=1 Tax=Globisporangium ultimum (strain ATCC 200006 / CBS 805.95 / DAOM BR144) TaxID=431595 RepID=K3WIJ2_GLOUD